MKVLGITGGVGSGKSEVLKYLENEYGAFVCQMDQTAKELQKKGTCCLQKIAETFGNGVLRSDGELDRPALAKIVFSDAQKLDLLNKIVHPAVLEKTREMIKEKKEENTPLFVTESALLPEVGKELCDEIWYIYVREDVRRERLKMSRGYTDEQITRMIASQADEQRFRSVCTAVIDNNGDFEETKRQMEERLKL